MKNRILLVAVVIAMSLTQKAFADNTSGLTINRYVLESFRNDFILTSDVKWNKINEVFVVDFKQQGIAYTAYYTEEGMLNSISSSIEKDKLPAVVTGKINRKYKNAEIIRALKVRLLPDGISYIIHFNAGGIQKIIDMDSDGNIETIKTIK